MYVDNENKPFAPKTIIVHAGKFHCDDVMCVALMKEINPAIVVERISEDMFVEKEDTIIADVGFGQYDHHQIDTKKREDGRKHAACGLIFEDYWRQLLDDERFYESFRKKYIIPIEDADNGCDSNPLSCFVDMMNPTWNSGESVDSAFQKVVDIIRLLIRQEVTYFKSLKDTDQIIGNAIKSMENGIVVLSQYCPWQYYLCSNPDAKYVVFPSSRNPGKYNAQVIPVSVGSRQAKIDFPENIDVGVCGCTFMHPSRFLAEFDTIKAAKTALYNSGKG